MNSHPLTFLRILAIGFILVCTTIAWLVLGSAILIRTEQRDGELGTSVNQIWGSAITQSHPQAWYLSPTGEKGRRMLRPTQSRITVDLDYEPKSKGLLRYRTYFVRFRGEYQITNPTPIAQTIYVQFQLPDGGSELEGVEFQVGDGGNAVTSIAPQNQALTQAIVIPSGGSVPLRVGYSTRGRDVWSYDLSGIDRLRDFSLTAVTNFDEIDFPAGTTSPSRREVRPNGGWNLQWSYSDVIDPHRIGVAMPNVLNAGPVAARISFFAPISLVFFFAVLLILGAVRGTNLHPMNYFFLAAGCFAFQLLFAYLVDHLPVHASFAISAAVSMLLVGGYLYLVGGRALASIALPAQFCYMVLFSYSFFFEGASGLTITIGAVITLAVLMVASARVDWSARFARKPKTPAVV